MKTRVALIALAIAAFGVAASDPGYHLLKTIALTGEGGQDYLAIDESARRLYVTHSTQVEVVDIDNDQPVGKIRQDQHWSKSRWRRSSAEWPHRVCVRIEMRNCVIVQLLTNY
jgi:hypothetical protein